MKNKFRFFRIIAFAAVISFTFIACEGPRGPEGRALEPEIRGGYWYIGGLPTGVRAQWVQPTIVNGYWYIGGVNTGRAQGAQGDAGETPTIGDSGYWYVGGDRLGRAEWMRPTISNGFWYIGGERIGTTGQAPLNRNLHEGVFRGTGMGLNVDVDQPHVAPNVTAVVDVTFSTPGAASFGDGTIVDVVIYSLSGNVMQAENARQGLPSRIIEQQSAGVDGIAGATLSSLAITRAVKNAIILAGGNYTQWLQRPNPRWSTEVLFAGTDEYGNVLPFDVAVVGLGGSGTSALLAAAQAGATVFGIEQGTFAGGLTLHANGLFGIRTQWSQTRNPGANQSDAVFMDHFMWTFGGEARPFAAEGSLTASPHWEATTQHPGRKAFPERMSAALGNLRPPTANDGHPLTFAGSQVQGWEGGARRENMLAYVQNTTRMIHWLYENDFFFLAPAAGQPNNSGMVWRPDMDWGHTTHGLGAARVARNQWYNNAVQQAIRRDARSGAMFNLRAEELVTIPDPDGDADDVIVIGVRARHDDGRRVIVRAENTIIATGGFIGNPHLFAEVHGGLQNAHGLSGPRQAQGDGILMAIRDANAATFNLAAPPMIHQHRTQRYVVAPWMTNSAGAMGANPAHLDTLFTSQLRTLVGTSIGYDTFDRRGKRFMSEIGGITGGGMGRTIAFENQRAGGNTASIWSNDYLWRVLIEEPQRTLTPEGVEGRTGTVQPTLFANLDWGVRVSRNVVRDDYLVGLARQLGMADAYHQFTRHMDLYNEVVMIARAMIEDGRRTWPVNPAVGYTTGTGAAMLAPFPIRPTGPVMTPIPPHMSADSGSMHVSHVNSWTVPAGVNLEWQGDAITHVHGSMDPQANTHNFLQGYYNFGKPIFSGNNMLWDRPVTRRNEQQASWDAWVDSLDAAQYALLQERLNGREFEPGFVAVLGRGNAYGTFGGIDINQYNQALRFNPSGNDGSMGDVIPGLFIVGTDAMGPLTHRQITYANTGAFGNGWVHQSGLTAGLKAAGWNAHVPPGPDGLPIQMPTGFVEP